MEVSSDGCGAEPMRGFASGGLLVTGMHWQGQSTQQLPTLSEQDDVQLHGGQAG